MSNRNESKALQIAMIVSLFSADLRRDVKKNPEILGLAASAIRGSGVYERVINDDLNFLEPSESTSGTIFKDKLLGFRVLIDRFKHKTYSLSEVASFLSLAGVRDEKEIEKYIVDSPYYKAVNDDNPYQMYTGEVSGEIANGNDELRELNALRADSGLPPLIGASSTPRNSTTPQITNNESPAQIENIIPLERDPRVMVNQDVSRVFSFEDVLCILGNVYHKSLAYLSYKGM